MILGILDTDVLREDLQATYGSYARMFKQLFNQVDTNLDENLEYKFYQVTDGEYPESINDCDAYLITGSKSSAYDQDNWIKTLSSYINTLYQADIKMLGICFGHQLIAHTLGGKTELAPPGWGVGVHNYKTTVQGKKLNPELNQGFSLLVSHRDQVVSLPKQATLVAKSDFCPNAAYQINNQVLCFQGHPEFVPMYADALMQKRKADIPTDTYNRAQGNLNEPTQHLQVAKTLLEFALNKN